VTQRQNPVLDEIWMKRALELAKSAAHNSEVPVGAVVVFEGQEVAAAANCKETSHDPTGHAEIVALKKAAESLGRWRLSGCTLYVTLEPCVMCAGAIVQARVDRVVYATPDPKAGGVESLYQILSDPRLNHRPKVDVGVLKDEASQLLKAFFKQRRKDKFESN